MLCNRRGIILFGIGLIIASLLAYWLATQNEKRLLALDAKSGRVLWLAALSDRQSKLQSPVVANHRVFLGIATKEVLQNSYNWQLKAFDAVSGRRIWQYSPNLQQVESGAKLDGVDTGLLAPYASADSVYAYISIEDGEDQLVAIDAATGKQRWLIKREWSNFDKLGVVAVGNRVIIISPEKDPTRIPIGKLPENKVILKALDTRTATQIWQVKLNDIPYEDLFQGLNLPSVLVASDRTVFFKPGITRAYDIETGKLQFRIADRNGDEIKLINSTLYSFGYGELSAFNAVTGDQLWSRGNAKNSNFTCAGTGSARRFQASDQVIYVTCGIAGRKSIEDEEGWLLALDAKNGSERWFKQVNSGYWDLFESLPASNSESVFIVRKIKDTKAGKIAQLLALSAKDGAEIWNFPLAESDFFQPPVTDGDRVFVIDTAPRWRNWLEYLNPAWH